MSWYQKNIQSLLYSGYFTISLTFFIASSSIAVGYDGLFLQPHSKFSLTMHLHPIILALVKINFLNIELILTTNKQNAWMKILTATILTTQSISVHHRNYIICSQSLSSHYL